MQSMFQAFVKGNFFLRMPCVAASDTLSLALTWKSLIKILEKPEMKHKI